MASEDNFFDIQSEASGVKARIISKHFDSWSSIVLKEATKLGQRIAYIDLYCGPGRYGDGKMSTPLLVLERAIKKPELTKSLVTIFNDEDPEAIEKLKAEVSNLPGVTSLAVPPVLMNTKVLLAVRAGLVLGRWNLSGFGRSATSALTRRSRSILSNGAA